jgi:anti-sigma B factor antagonist
MSPALEKEVVMAGFGGLNDQIRSAAIDGIHDSAEGLRKTRSSLEEPESPPRWRVRVIERVAMIRISGSEFLLEERVVGGLVDRLEDLVTGEGHTRLVLNFRGVRYVSSSMLDKLVRFQKEVARRGGCLRICGLDPLLRDLLRACHLDPVFDICADEAEALGLILS